MPTILLVMGWRFFFYANEMIEPIHIHCKKAEKECKYWIDRDNFDVDEASSYNMNNKEYVFQIEKISKKLLNASQIERDKYEISPSGYGLHWPLLDEDLSIDGLLGIKHAPSQKKEMVAI